MNREQVNRLVYMMQENDLKFNRHFSMVLDHGFSDSASENFFENVAMDLERVLICGINGGCNGGVKKAVFTLTDVAVKLGEDHQSPSALEKLRKKERAAMEAAHLPSGPVGMMEMKWDLVQYLENTRQGLDILTACAEGKNTCEDANRTKCRDMLTEIMVSVGRVVDVSSEAAVESYNAIVTELNAWREARARAEGLYDMAAVTRLANIRARAAAWASSCHAVRTVAKTPRYAIPFDDLSRVTSSDNILRDIEVFLLRCDRFSEDLTLRYNDTAREAIRGYRAKLKDVEAEEQRVVARFKAGEITREQAEDMLELLSRDRETLEFQIDRVADAYSPTEDIARCRRMLLSIERPVRQTYAREKNNRLHLFNLFDGVEFSTLVAMLNNNVSSREFEEGVTALQSILITRGIITERVATNITVIEDKLRALGEFTDTREKEPKKSRLAAAMEKHGLGEMPAETVAKEKAPVFDPVFDSPMQQRESAVNGTNANKMKQ